MIYVLVRNCWDYHHFEKVVGASTSLGAIAKKATKEYGKYPVFLENSPAYEEFLKTYNDNSYYMTIKELEDEA